VLWREPHELTGPALGSVIDASVALQIRVPADEPLLSAESFVRASASEINSTSSRSRLAFSDPHVPQMLCVRHRLAAKLAGHSVGQPPA
jgi:hypothetical protein